MHLPDTWLQTSTGSFAIRDSGGPGRAVLLVHGTGHNLEVWEPVAALLRAEFRVMSFDLRGHGQTPVDSVEAEDHWRDLAALIAALELPDPILAGHSGGGYAATAHVASGGAAAGLVVIDGFVPDSREIAVRSTGVVPRDKLWELFRYGWKATDAEKEAWVQRVKAEAPTDWLNAGIDPSRVETFTRRSFLRHGDHWLRRPTLDEISRLSQLDASRPILPSAEVYDRIRAPATFVWAKQGLYRERRADVVQLAASAHATFVEADSGHNVHLQQPALVAQAIRDLAGRI